MFIKKILLSFYQVQYVSEILQFKGLDSGWPRDIGYNDIYPIKFLRDMVIRDIKSQGKVVVIGCL